MAREYKEQDSRDEEEKLIKKDNDEKNYNQDVIAVKVFLKGQLPVLVSGVIAATEDMNTFNIFLKFTEEFVRWMSKRQEQNQKRLDILNIIRISSLGADNEIKKALFNLEEKHWKTISSLSSACVSFLQSASDKATEKASDDTAANSLNPSQTLANSLYYASNIINSLASEVSNPDKVKIYSFFLILSQHTATLNFEADSELSIFKQLNFSLLPAIVIPAPTLESNEPFVNTRFITSAGYMGYALWIFVFFPFALLEGALRALGKLTEQISKNPVAIFWSQVLVFPFLVILWPGKAIELFPKKAYWISGLLRIISLAIWLVIGIFVCPPILSKLGWSFAVENLGPFFSLLEGINVTATDMLIGIGIGGYALLGQILRTVLDTCFIRDGRISPAPSRYSQNLTPFISPENPMRSIDPTAAYEGEPSTKPPSHEPTPLPTPAPTPAKSTRNLVGQTPPAPSLHAFVHSTTQEDLLKKVRGKRNQDNLHDSPNKKGDNETKKSLSAPTSSGNSSSSEEGSPPQGSYTLAGAAGQVGQFNARERKSSDTPPPLHRDESVVRLHLGEGVLVLPLPETDCNSSTTSTSDSTTSSSSFSAPGLRNGSGEDER